MLLLFRLPAGQLPDLRRVDSSSRNSRPGRPRFELRDRDRRRFKDKAAVLLRTVLPLARSRPFRRSICCVSVITIISRFFRS